MKKRQGRPRIWRARGFYFSWGDRPVLPKQPSEDKPEWREGRIHANVGEERPQRRSGGWCGSCWGSRPGGNWGAWVRWWAPGRIRTGGCGNPLPMLKDHSHFRLEDGLYRPQEEARIRGCWRGPMTGEGAVPVGRKKWPDPRCSSEVELTVWMDEMSIKGKTHEWLLGVLAARDAVYWDGNGESEIRL